MPHLWNKVVCIFNFFLERWYPSLQGLPPLWKKYHSCFKIYGRHDELFLQECCAHLRALLQSNDTLYQRNVALSVGECCMEVRHNFLKDRNILLKFISWLLRRMLLPQNLSWHYFLKQLSLQNLPYLLSCRELCQKDAVLSGDNEISCQWKVLFSLAHACYTRHAA